MDGSNGDPRDLSNRQFRDRSPISDTDSVEPGIRRGRATRRELRQLEEQVQAAVGRGELNLRRGPYVIQRSDNLDRLVATGPGSNNEGTAPNPIAIDEPSPSPSGVQVLAGPGNQQVYSVPVPIRSAPRRGRTSRRRSGLVPLRLSRRESPQRIRVYAASSRMSSPDNSLPSTSFSSTTEPHSASSGSSRTVPFRLPSRETPQRRVTEAPSRMSSPDHSLPSTSFSSTTEPHSASSRSSGSVPFRLPIRETPQRRVTEAPSRMSNPDHSLPSTSFSSTTEPHSASSWSSGSVPFKLPNRESPQRRVSDAGRHAPPRMQSPESPWSRASDTDYPNTTGSRYPNTTGSTYPNTTDSTYPTTTGSTNPTTTGSTNPNTTGSTNPNTTGSTHPTTTGSTYPNTTGSTHPTTTGSTYPNATGSTYPNTTGSTYPNTTGSTYPNTTGSTYPNTTGSTYPNTTGPTYPTTTGSTYPNTTGSTYPNTTGSTYPNTTDSTNPSATGSVPFRLPNTELPESRTSETRRPAPSRMPNHDQPPANTSTPFASPSRDVFTVRVQSYFQVITRTGHVVYSIPHTESLQRVAIGSDRNAPLSVTPIYYHALPGNTLTPLSSTSRDGIGPNVRAGSTSAPRSMPGTSSGSVPNTTSPTTPNTTAPTSPNTTAPPALNPAAPTSSSTAASPPTPHPSSHYSTSPFRSTSQAGPFPPLRLSDLNNVFHQQFVQRLNHVGPSHTLQSTDMHERLHQQLLREMNSVRQMGGSVSDLVTDVMRQNRMTCLEGLAPAHPYRKDEAIDCCICLEEIQKEQEIRQLPCKHVMHRDCIDHWYQERTSCPYCRADYPEPRTIRL